jgi:hypothetical protein
MRSAVVVHGGYTAQRALEAGVLDELQIHRSRCCSGVAAAYVAEPLDQRPLGYGWSG